MHLMPLNYTLKQWLTSKFYVYVTIIKKLQKSKFQKKQILTFKISFLIKTNKNRRFR